MDFLSKINANAGIDVKKDFVANNATVKNFEVSGTAIDQTVTTINSGKATFNNSEFAVHAGHGVTIDTGDAELNISGDGEINLDIVGSHIQMNSEFLELCSRAPINIKYDYSYGINIIDNSSDSSGLLFNTEFFKLYYRNPSFTTAIEPAFEITSNLINPSAEIKSKRLNISSYSKNNNGDYSGNITLRVTPAEFVDDTTKEPIDNNHDVFLKVYDCGIQLNTGNSTADASMIELYTRKPDGSVYIDSGNITMLAGSEFEVSSYTSNINSASYINMGAGSSQDASIRISSSLDEENTTPNNGSLVKINGSAVKIDSTEYLVNAYANLKFTGGSVEIDTTEYLINNAEKFSVDTSEFLVNNFGSFKLNGDLTSRFIFTGFGIEINTTEFLVNSSGITFNTVNDSVWSYHSIDSCAKNLCIKAPETRFDDTNGVFIAFKDSGGNMSFTRNGISVNTTPEGATSPISGNALLSQSLRSIERMTQSEYDAIETKDENTLYIIAG